MSKSRSQILSQAVDHYRSGAFLRDLARRVAIPTESAVPDRADAMRQYLSDEIAPALEGMGYVHQSVENPVRGRWPFLIASRIEDPSLPTVLTYGHGDVVQGLTEQWSDGLDPWRLEQRGEKIYGRGTADNKAQHTILLSALELVLKTKERHGFNSKILIDMGEEIGSPGLEQVLHLYQEQLSADFLLASDGPRLKVDHPDIKLGNRGSLRFELSVDLREGSRHSGHWGGVLEDPGIILSHALSSITTSRGRIRVDGWLPKSIPHRVRALVRECHVEPGDDFPYVAPDWGETELTREEKMYAWTSFIVLAFITGKPDNPVCGVQPNATATCEIRYTVDVDSSMFLPSLRRHLDAQGFQQVEIVPCDEDEFPAARTDPDDRWVRWCVESIERTTGEAPIIVPNGAGSLPTALFMKHLNLPAIWVPHSYTGCKQHGPNEHVLEPLMSEGLEIMTGLFWDLGDVGSRGG